MGVLFPSAPTEDDLFTANNVTYRYTNGVWRVDANAPVPSKWREIERLNISAGASFDITWTAGVYALVKVYVLGAKVNTAGATADLLMRVRVAGVWKTGASDYDNVSNSNFSNTNNPVSAAQDAIRIANSGNNAARNVFAEILIQMGSANLRRTNILHEARYVNNSAQAHRHGSSSIIDDSAPVDGVRFLWLAGNFVAEGSVVVEGLLA